jgi:hypothetical protein
MGPLAAQHEATNLVRMHGGCERLAVASQHLPPPLAAASAKRKRTTLNPRKKKLKKN